MEEKRIEEITEEVIEDIADEVIEEFYDEEGNLFDVDNNFEFNNNKGEDDE